MNEISDTYVAFSKSQDEESPLSQTHLPRGSAGITTLCNSSPQAQMAAEGSHRTNVPHLDNINLKMGNTYLPCRWRYPLENFQQELGQIIEICQTYSDIPLIVASDFNVDIHGTQDSRTKYSKAFISDNKLKEAIAIKQATCHQHSGKEKSKIDYNYVRVS